MGPETVCLVHMEPVQNAGGAFTPPERLLAGVREICDRYDILLSADEVITAFGRLGHWFGSERYDIRPDIVTIAKGLSSSYAAIGARRRDGRGHGALPRRDVDVLARDHVRRAPGHVRDRAQEPRDHEAGADRRGGARERGRLPATLAQLLDLPIVGDLRGTGFFYAIELVKDKDTRETFSDEECETPPPRLPLERALRGGPHLPRGRPRRPRHPDLAAARRRRRPSSTRWSASSAMCSLKPPHSCASWTARVLLLDPLAPPSEIDELAAASAAEEVDW